MQLEKLQDQKPECHLEWPNKCARACEMYRLLAIRMATQQEYEDILVYKTAASNAGQKRNTETGFPLMTR